MQQGLVFGIGNDLVDFPEIEDAKAFTNPFGMESCSKEKILWHI
jgi:hypothetical protein